MTAPTSAEFYRTVRLIRRFEERAMELARSGEIVGGIHPCIGQEAVAAGCCAALRPDDLMTSHHRAHGHTLAKGATPVRLLAELFGRVTGMNRGRGGSMHAADVGLGILGANGTVGAGASIATGAAWAARRRGSDQVVMSIFGDGAINEGMVLEAYNLAALLKLPVVFVCENNGYSVTSSVQSLSAGSLTARPEAFGVPASSVDGQDPEVVYEAARAAVEYARAGRPVFVEFRSYRFGVHHTRDHQMRLNYRTAEEVAAGRARDPLDIQGARIDPAQRAAIDAEVEATLDEAVRAALAAPTPDPAGALDYLYATGLQPRMGVV